MLPGPQHPGSFELCKSMRAKQPMGEHLDLHTCMPIYKSLGAG